MTGPTHAVASVQTLPREARGRAARKYRGRLKGESGLPKPNSPSPHFARPREGPPPPHQPRLCLSQQEGGRPALRAAGGREGLSRLAVQGHIPRRSRGVGQAVLRLEEFPFSSGVGSCVSSALPPVGIASRGWQRLRVCDLNLLWCLHTLRPNPSPPTSCLCHCSSPVWFPRYC